VYCDIVGKPGSGSADANGFTSCSTPARHTSRWRQELAFFILCLRKVWFATPARCDVIQVRDMVSIGLFSMLIARIKGIPFTYWVSFLMCDGRIERSRAELARRPGSLHYRLALCKGLLEKVLFYKVVLARADHVFVQSETMKRGMIERGIASDKMTVVPMGVDTEILKAGVIVPRRLPQWDTLPVIAYLGTLDRSRQIEILFDALVIVRRSHPTARLLLIGSSPTPSDLDLLHAHAQSLGMDEAIHITGWLSSAEALPLLLGADVGVSYLPRGPLLDVNSPTKLLEYLALGMPAVGNDNPDQTQVLGASAAGWLSASTPEALAAALSTVLDNNNAARAKAAAGVAYIEQHRSYRVLSAVLAQRYHSLLRHLA
jgi:glycosyltransferase involved in cell wall biosynthesis